MLFREIVAVYCEENTNSAQNTEFRYVKNGGIYSNPSALRDKIL
jgi:hypothetical protein